MSWLPRFCDPCLHASGLSDKEGLALLGPGEKNRKAFVRGRKFYLFIKSPQHLAFTTDLPGTQKVSINTGLSLNESSVCCLTEQGHINLRCSWRHQLAGYPPRIP